MFQFLVLFVVFTYDYGILKIIYKTVTDTFLNFSVLFVVTNTHVGFTVAQTSSNKVNLGIYMFVVKLLY